MSSLSQLPLSKGLAIQVMFTEVRPEFEPYPRRHVRATLKSTALLYAVGGLTFDTRLVGLEEQVGVIGLGIGANASLHVSATRRERRTHELEFGSKTKRN